MASIAPCVTERTGSKGDIAADMKSKVTDFTDPATLKNVTDGELFYIIKNGKGEMPPYARQRIRSVSSCR
jgi:hypothetical protein